MQVVRSFFIAISMYSKLPVPHVKWEEKDMRYVLVFFPFVGALIGAASFLWFLICSALSRDAVQHNIGAVITGSTSIFYTLILCVIPLIVTGGIHLDGFMDTQDAISAYRSKEERLRILQDPHIGAFAVISTLVLAAFYVGGVFLLREDQLPVMTLIFVLGRVISALSVLLFENAHRDGTAAGFRDAADRSICILALGMELAVTSIALLIINLFTGAVIVVTAAVCLAVYKRCAYRLFGGITGDLAGWFLCICTTACIVAAAVVGCFL